MNIFISLIYHSTMYTGTETYYYAHQYIQYIQVCQLICQLNLKRKLEGPSKSPVNLDTIQKLLISFFFSCYL